VAISVTTQGTQGVPTLSTTVDDTVRCPVPRIAGLVFIASWFSCFYVFVFVFVFVFFSVAACWAFIGGRGR